MERQLAKQRQEQKRKFKLRKKWFRQILWRRIFVTLLLLLQGLVLIRLTRNTSLAQGISIGLTLVSLLALRVINSRAPLPAALGGADPDRAGIWLPFLSVGHTAILHPLSGPADLPTGKGQHPLSAKRGRTFPPSRPVQREVSCGIKIYLPITTFP